MAQTFALRKLLEVAETQTATAAAALGSLNQHLQRHEAKLDLLLKYREEYQQRLRNAKKRGLDGLSLRNFHDFMERLEQAIGEQRALVADAHHRVTGGRDEWNSKQRRFKAFDTLSQRFDSVAQRHASNAEQKLQDDYAARMATLKRQNGR